MTDVVAAREERFKGGVHAATATLLGTMLAYNALRLCHVPTRRNVLNICLYAPLLVYEWSQARRHWSRQ